MRYQTLNRVVLGHGGITALLLEAPVTGSVALADPDGPIRVHSPPLFETHGRFPVHVEQRPSNLPTGGSYTCYLPGQFTTIAGNEAKPIDNLFFDGEHTNSFYEFQGFMEGAALSGIAAASAILQSLKKS